jgi:hypothetical protein
MTDPRAVRKAVSSVSLLALTLGAICDSSSGPDFDHTVSGKYEGQIVETNRATGGGVTITCVFTFALTGTTTLRLSEEAGGAVKGEAEITDSNKTLLSTSDPARCTPPGGFGSERSWDATQLSGTVSNLRFRYERTDPTVTTTVEFAGAFSNNVVTGSLKFIASGQNTNGPTTNVYSGSTTIAVTLR